MTTQAEADFRAHMRETLRHTKVINFMDTLGDYIKAEVAYETNTDPEWRNNDEVIKTANALQASLEMLLK